MSRDLIRKNPVRGALALAALPAILVMTGAADAPPAIHAAFGNTIISTYPDGRTAELWLKPSGRYTAMGRRKDRSSGHWRVSGDKLCLRQSSPIWVPFSYCTPIPTGTSWRAKAVTGEPIQVRLVKGIRKG